MTYLSNKNINLSLDNLLDFIHKYLEDNLSGYVKEIDVIFHLKSKQRIEEFKQILELEQCGVLQLKKLELEKNHNDKNGEFEKYFEKFRLYEEKGLLYEFTKKPSFVGRVKNKLGIPINISAKKALNLINQKEKKLIKLDTFSSFSIYDNWNEFNSKVPPFTVLKGNIKILSSIFFDILFNLIYKEEKDFLLKDVRELYENIISETGGKTNYEREIKIFYDLKNYINNKSSIYPILYELHERCILNILKIEIKDGYLYFILNYLNTLSLAKFEEAYNIVKRKVADIAIFKDDNLYINGEKIDFRNKETKKTFNLIKLFFELQQDNKNHKIKFEELEEIYNRKKYKWLLKSKFKYADLRKTIGDFNNRIFTKYNIKTFIVVNKSGLECKYTKFY
ncbi:MAG: hypothetical protein PHV23_01470 [Candidatus Gracilibacteria bacterium]|nr:hypothetical protein [Candidatus Gracilibacteria bacterium]